MKFVKSLFFLILFFSLSCQVFSQNLNGGVRLVIYPSWIGQGESFSVRIFSDSAIKGIRGSIFGENFPFFLSEDAYRAIVGVPVDLEPGKYTLILTVEGASGNKETLVTAITINRSKFDRVSFHLRKGKTDLMASDIVDEDWAKIEKEVIRSTNEQLWEGPFSKPARGLISMHFGTRQVINGRVAGQHKGLDIAGKSYYKIKAANSGQVVFAQYLRAFGNTVVINHGEGVFSLYFHMSKIFVKKNDLVWKGAVLGNMGATGVTTGVHLHWAMSVANVRVDPLQWLKNSALVE